MIDKIKIDSFSRNVIIVFLGTSLVNFFNLLYQLLIAHRLSAADFAAFNSLFSILMIVSAPLGTSLQTAVAKYSSEYSANNKKNDIQAVLSVLLKKSFLFSLLTFLLFYFSAPLIVGKLKIPSLASAYILALLLSLAWLRPILLGGLQGLEKFGWLISESLSVGVVKLILAFLFIWLGFNIAGALGAILVASLIGISIALLPLIKMKLISFKKPSFNINLQEILLYLFPVGFSYFCFLALVSIDMILVKYFFSSQDAGLYSLAQVLGKIFLFLPFAISIVMFPRTSKLKAQKQETHQTLKRSLIYGSLLCLAAIVVYNIFPAFVLKILTGKAPLTSLRLGRLFSISMSLFALVYIFISYFLSLRDLRFLKYLAISALLQIIAICIFHGNLIQVQIIICVNAALLFIIISFLARKSNELSKVFRLVRR